MALKIIAAVAMNGVIGAKGEIPWKLPKDMGWFRDQTSTDAVVMGRKTYWSLPDKYRPLPGRENIVLTHNLLMLRSSLVSVVTNFAEVLARSARENIWAMGGTAIYELALPHASEMLLTRVQAIVPGDAYFPEWSSEEWRLDAQERIAADERNQYSFTWETWRRR